MISYKKTGAGPVIVLLHGFPNDGSSWNNIVPALSEKYTLLIPDLPGAGESPLPEAPLTLTYIAETIKTMLDHEKVSSAVVAGHSMGGYTTLEFALYYPEYVKGISLVHASAYPDSVEKKENRRKAIQLMLKGDIEKETFLRAMAGNLFAAAFSEKFPDIVTRIVNNGMKLPAINLAAFYLAIMQRTDKTELLKQIHVPVQFIIGNEDTATPMKDALEQCYLSQVSKISLYKPCGHMSMEEMPEKLTADLLDFFTYCF